MRPRLAAREEEQERAASDGLALGALFLLALGLRLWGVRFGLPMPQHMDEGNLIGVALRMLDTGNPDPRWFVWPTFYIYLQTAVLALVRPFVDAADIQSAARVAGRAVTAFFGAATVLPVFATARMLAGRLAAVCAGLTLALCFLHVEHSHYLPPDVPCALFVALCMWAAVRGMQEASTRWLVVSGIMAGLAAATKYNAGLCLVMPLAVAALLPGVSLGRRVVLALWIGSSALLTFAAAMPWIWLAPRRVIASLSGVGAFYQRGQAGAESPSNWGFYGVYLWESGLTAGLAAAAILGWGALARSRPRAWLVATAFLVLYAALVASLRGRFVRNLMPLTGPIAVLSGIGFSCALAWLDRRPRGWRMAGRVAIGLAFAFAGLRVALYDYYLTETDTRVVARAWLEREEPGVSMCFAERALAPIPFAVPHLDLAGKECDLVIVSSHMYGPFLEDPEVDPAATAHYRDLFSRWNLEAEFTYTSSPVVRWLLGSDLPMHSPVVRVYRVSQGAPGG